MTEAFWGYDGRSDTEQVDMPPLVIYGPADGIVPIDAARGTARRLLNGVFCRMERTGHVAMIERPAAYNRLLRTLLAAIEDDRDLESPVRDRLGEHTSD